MNIQEDLSTKLAGMSQVVDSSSLTLSTKQNPGAGAAKSKADSSQKVTPSPSDLGARLNEMNSSLAAIGHELKLHVDEKTQIVQAVITDANNKVVRKIPSDELIKLQASQKKGNVALDKSV